MNKIEFRNRLNTSPFLSFWSSTIKKSVNRSKKRIDLSDKENHQQADEAINTLAKEIESWKDFEYALKKMGFCLTGCSLNVAKMKIM